MILTWADYVAREPADIEPHVTSLRRWYNSNAGMIGNIVEMTEQDVREYWAGVAERRARGFLLFVGKELVGDFELRNIHEGHAEFSIMIGARQERGLGSRFAKMAHVLAFRELGLSRVYVQPKPENIRIQKLEDRLGYAPEDSELAMSITAETFKRLNADAWTEVVAS